MKRKVFISALIGLALAFSVKPVTKLWAGVGAPLDTQGHTIPTSDWVGAYPCNIDASNTTTAISCSSATSTFGGTVINTTGRGEVIGVIVSSVALTNFLVFRDSATANLTSATMTIVNSQSYGTTSAGNNSTGYFKFPVPIQYQTGLSVNSNASVQAGGLWTILYRPLNAKE